MNTITMPGFTAHASLYGTSNLYRSARSQRGSDSQVHPASCFSDCKRSCIQGCRSGPPFLRGQALGDCLRSCPAECHEECG